MPDAAPPVDDLHAFLEYLRFPTVSADPARAGDMRRCAGWLVGLLRSWGLGSRLVETDGPPLVLASTPRTGRPRVLLYGHYDVQPADPIERWRQDPFEPLVEGGVVTARGATDNKGQTTAMLVGLRRAARRGALPVDVTVILEGEEEVGSPHLAPVVVALGDELAASTLLVADTTMLEPDVPSLTLGLRGIAAMDVRVRGPLADLHSGSFGGAVANPAMALARLVAGLHDDGGAVAVPGFYEDVVEVPASERDAWRLLPFDDEALLAASGAPALAGESGYTALERTWMRPTAEVNGIGGGYDGPGSKTIIPREAFAKLSFRLVPRQDPATIARLVEDDLRRRAPAGVEVEVIWDHGGRPIGADVEGPSVRAAVRAIEAVAGRPPSLVREGLSIPALEPLIACSGAEPLLVGLGLPDCGAHSPNETFPLRHLELGARLMERLLQELGEALTPARPRPSDLG